MAVAQTNGADVYWFWLKVSRENMMIGIVTVTEAKKMQNSNESLTEPKVGLAPQLEVGRLAGAELARRRALLKGLGRGSAIVAAVVPIKTFALTQSVTADGKMCTASGVGSATHSFTTTPPTCGGMSPGYYKTPSHWPKYNSAYNKSSFVVVRDGSADVTVTVKFAFGGTSPGGLNDTAFSAIFGGGSNNGIYYIMLNEAPTAEFHWIAALLNAVWYLWSPAAWPLFPKVFPYTPAEVIKLYQTNPVAGLQFIKSYMEQH